MMAGGKGAMPSQSIFPSWDSAFEESTDIPKLAVEANFKVYPFLDRGAVFYLCTRPLRRCATSCPYHF